MAVPSWLSYIFQTISVHLLEYITGIPRSTLYAYRAGRYLPSPPRLRRFREMYGTIQRRRLEMLGFPSSIAERIKFKSPRTIERYIREHFEIASTLAEMYERPIEYIMSGLRRSTKSWKMLEKSAEIARAVLRGIL